MQLFDPRGNEFQGQLDQIGGATITDPRSASATLAAAQAELVMDLNGKAVALFHILVTANATMTFVFEGTLDGNNYFPLPAQTFTTEAQVTSVALAAAQVNQVYVCGCSGFRRVRCRVSAYTSGSAVVTGRASLADFAIYSKPTPTTLWVSATAAAGVAITLTLPGVAGMFHYITHIDLSRATNVAEAAAAPLVITTSNLPGSPAWTVGAAIPLGGQTADVRADFMNPLKSLAAGTATTIIAPDPGTSAIWRLNAGYYLGF